jgi:methionyl-tRNA formyltransferase
VSDALGFAATSAYGADCLRRLVAAGAPVRLVLTQPDRPAGRRRQPTPPPAADAARELGLQLLQPERAGDAIAGLRAAGIGAMGICAYGQLIPDALLAELPWVNLHPSSLPRWRGAAPVERTILAGDPATAAAVMAVVRELDAGPIATLEPFPVGPRATAGDVMTRSLELGVPPLAAGLAAAAAGELETRPQATDGLPYAHKLTADDRLLDPAEPVALADRRVRALAPHIGAALQVGGQRLLVWRAEPVGEELAPGEVAAEGGRLAVGFADGALELLDVQAAGKRTMTAAELLRGWRGAVGPATRGSRHS